MELPAKHLFLHWPQEEPKWWEQEDDPVPEEDWQQRALNPHLKSQTSTLPLNYFAFCPGLRSPGSTGGARRSSLHPANTTSCPRIAAPQAPASMHLPFHWCVPKGKVEACVMDSLAWRASYHCPVLIKRTWKCGGGSTTTVISKQAASKGSDSCGDVLGPAHPARSNTPAGLFIIPDSRVLK